MTQLLSAVPAYLASWTGDQWIMFACFTAAGLAGLGLGALEIRRHRIRRAEALIAQWAAIPSYTLTINERRGELGLLPYDAQPLTEALMQQHLDASRTRVPSPAGVVVRYEPYVIITATDHTEPVLARFAEEVAEIEAHIAAGPGSLSTLAEVGGGSLLAAEPSIEPEIAARFAFAFDRPAYTPTRSEAGVIDAGGLLAQFNARLGDAMATVRAWQASDPIADARHTLDEWRRDTPTGEWPLYVRPDRQREMAEALPVAV